MEFIVTNAEDGKLLGEVLKQRGISRRLITKLKRTDGGIMRDGKLVRTVDEVYSGDKIVLSEGEGETLEANENLQVKILYEDNDLIVFDKPSFMPCHPSINHRTDTLGNFFAYYCKGLTFRPVNRLDRDTSGCVVVAKNQHSAHFLQNCCEKKYYGLAEHFPFSGGRISAPIARETESIIIRCIREDGQYAVTNYRVVARKGENALIEFLLETGRTHQIRVHMAHIGFPLIGDSMYGGNCERLKSQALHCKEVTFIQPTTKEKITVRSNIPDDWDF